MTGRNSDFPNTYYPDEGAHTVYLDSYYIDKYEVTNTFYKACVDVGICASPTNTSFDYGGTSDSYYGNLEFNDFPVVYVDWNMAKTYCEWRGGTLPTEAQWEKAARGTDERTYPWGEWLSCNLSNNGRNDMCIGATTKVGSYENGKSPYGLYDMSGNVFEWVADWYDENYYRDSPSSNPLGPDNGEYRGIRGGSFAIGRPEISNRDQQGPDNSNNITGFRCAMDSNP